MVWALSLSCAQDEYLLATESCAASGGQEGRAQEGICNLSKQIAVDAPWEPASRTGPESPPFPPPVCRGPPPEFADLASGPGRGELGGACQANERVPQRARLLLHALIGPETLEAGREWEWRAPPTAPRVPPAALAPSFSCCAPGTGGAQAALRIAHAGGAAVFVGWGSGLPLVAGTRAARVSREAAWEWRAMQKEVLGAGDPAYHPGRDCPAGRESWPLRSIRGEELSATGRVGSALCALWRDGDVRSCKFKASEASLAAGRPAGEHKELPVE